MNLTKGQLLKLREKVWTCFIRDDMPILSSGIFLEKTTIVMYLDTINAQHFWSPVSHGYTSIKGDFLLAGDANFMHHQGSWYEKKIGDSKIVEPLALLLYDKQIVCRYRSAFYENLFISP